MTHKITCVRERGRTIGLFLKPLSLLCSDMCPSDIQKKEKEAQEIRFHFHPYQLSETKRKI